MATNDSTDLREQDRKRQMVYDIAFRAALRLDPEATPAAQYRNTLNRLHMYAMLDAAEDGVAIVSPGQALIDQMWSDLPPCGGQCVASRDEFEQATHLADCPRGVAIRRIHRFV